jgi:N-acetylglucosaminyldiphosphoundecaprenol N-acetyl-beta-D-mannosaminyltransferase
MPMAVPSGDSAGGRQARLQNGDRHDILGVKVDVLTFQKALLRFDEWIRSRARQFVCVADAHVVMQAQWNDDFREILNEAGMVTPDGMPLVYLLRSAKRGPVDRVYGPDLLLRTCEHSIFRQYRHFFLGAAPGVAQRMAEHLRDRFPGLVVSGVFSPPFRPTTEAEDLAIAAVINRSRPDFVWVGLGTPKQERWMYRFRKLLNAPILISVGSAFDYFSEEKRQAPRALQRIGLEWLFRLVYEPRRLWPRYSRVIPGFLYLLALQRLRASRHRPESAEAPLTSERSDRMDAP